MSAVAMMAGAPIAPFFRYPQLRQTGDLKAYLAERNVAAFSIDIDSQDFKIKKPDQLVASIMTQLKKKQKGIILMHDIHKRTAEALPLLLAELKAKGYRIVHMTAKAPVTTVAEYDEAIEHDAKGLPQVGAERPLSSVVHTVGGTPPAAEKEKPEKAAAEPVAPETTPVTAAPATPAHKAATAAPETETEPEGLATEHPAVDHVAPTNSPQPPASTPAPAANADASRTTTSSVVRTVQDGEASGAANGSAGAKEPSAHGPSKSFMERAKETWRIWFGD
jgi:hypothetical protein